ncbi:hypothetical protein NHX12_030504, partial [Muraenolepis orangiensis]
MVNGDFAKLTRKHGIKISAGFACTVEEIGLAVGEKVGHGSVRPAECPLIFLDQVEKVNCVIETGITVEQQVEVWRSFSAGFIAKIKVLYNKIESVLKFN